jgi:hypothetical protein
MFLFMVQDLFILVRRSRGNGGAHCNYLHVKYQIQSLIGMYNCCVCLYQDSRDGQTRHWQGAGAA